MLQIRGVADPDRRVLKARAAARGQSLNSYMLELIRREVACPTVAEVFERAMRRSERATASSLDSVQTARSDRERRLGARADA